MTMDARLEIRQDIEPASLPRRRLIRTGLAALLATGAAARGAAAGLPRRAVDGLAAGTTAGPTSGPVAGSPAAPDAAAAARSRHFPFGPVAPPRPIAAWPVRTHFGERTDLAALLRGRVSALQLVFTGCSATCPIQGAIFAQAQRELEPLPLPAQFISLSIDPLSDTPASLAAWLRAFSPRPGWLAAVPRIDDVTAIVESLSAGGLPQSANAADPHGAQVYVVDSRGALVWRLPAMPRPGDINAALRAVARRGRA